MKMLYRLALLLRYFCLLGSVTHLVLQNNDIYTKERSEYDLREYSSLQKALEQDELVKNADILLNKLESVKRNIVDDAPLLNPEEVGESDSEAHENDCLESGLLSDFDFSILPALEKEYEGYSRFEQYMCLGQELGDVPLCSLYTNTFYMGDYRHIPGVSSITEKSGSPAYALLPFIPTDDIALFGHCVHHYLQKDSTNWHAYFGASFYWRLIGNDGAALDCIFKSLYYAQDNVNYIDGPLVSLANLLSNAGHDSDAALVMEHSAFTPYLQQLKLWSAGNLYTLAEQYKLSLDLYNATLKLGPFPLADGRLETLECYGTVIRRMENQNNVLRNTLQKLQQRHQLETQYIGLQERMFSNLQNTTLPSHVIKQVQSTEDAVRNTHKLVLEQQEIQNTLSPANYRYSVMTSSFGREEEAVMTPSFEGGEGEEEGKKDVNWIRATRLKLERLVEQIKGQLSEDSEAPIYFDCAEEQQEEEGEGEDVLGCQMDAETMSKAADEEERRILASLMSAEMERLARKHEMRDMSRDMSHDGDHSNAHVTPPDDHVTSHDVSSQDFMLFTDMFPFSEQKDDESEGCEVLSGESDSWYQLKCRVLDENNQKVEKDVKIVIREQSSKSASIELVTDGNPETILPHIHNLLSLDSEVRRKLLPSSPPQGDNGNHGYQGDKPEGCGAGYQGDTTGACSGTSGSCHSDSGKGGGDTGADNQGDGKTGNHGDTLSSHGDVTGTGTSHVHDEESLTKLVAEHLQTNDIFETMYQIRQDRINSNTKNIENSVEIKFGEESWVLRLFKVDTSPTKVVRIEQCDKHTPIFSHGDPYIPLMSSLQPHRKSLVKLVNMAPLDHPLSPDCTTYMDLKNCFLCYDELIGVSRESHDTRHILEDFPLQELQLIFGDVEQLGAAIDAALKENPNNWLLYHLAATYHRTFTFDLGPAIQCTRRALAVVDVENRAIPLLTLANLLHQGRKVTDAMVVLLELLAIDPDTYLHHVLSSVLQVDIGRADGQFRAAMDAVILAHSPISEHLLNSLICYYRVMKEPFQPPYVKSVKSQRVSRDKRHPPFTKPLKAPIDGEIWRLEHHEGLTVDLTWVSG